LFLMRAAVVTVSTSKSAGDGEDVSGPKLRDLLEAAGCHVIAVELIPDERELIAGRLRFYADEEGCDLIATTGGTGLARDARGHPGRDRPRGPRLCRGDASGLA
jgi:molybdopterin adenylyltransferase